LKNTLKQIWQTLTGAYDSGWNLLLLNLVWIVVTLLAFGLAQLAVYGAGQALPSANEVLLTLVYYLALILFNAFPVAGLVYAVRQLVEDDYDGLKTFFAGIRQYWQPALAWLGLNGLVVFALNFYVNILAGQGTLAATLLVSLLVAVLLWWLLTQVYAFPLLMYQEKANFFTALRNSLVVYARYPLYATGIALLIFLVVAVSYIFRPLVYVVSGALVVFLACAGAAYVLELLNPPPPAATPEGEA
jgi:uncharacterized membrane protein YesL